MPTRSSIAPLIADNIKKLRRNTGYSILCNSINRNQRRMALKMAVSNIKASFKSNIQKTWQTVTSLEEYSWRSDLGKIEIINDKQFIEYTKQGYATTFTITATEPYKRWEFNMENENIKGHWSGIFTANGEQTEIDFTEDVIAKKIFMKPFVKFYLKKQQTQYISDLRKALES